MNDKALQRWDIRDQLAFVIALKEGFKVSAGILDKTLADLKNNKHFNNQGIENDLKQRRDRLEDIADGFGYASSHLVQNFKTSYDK